MRFLGMGVGWLYVLRHPVKAFVLWLKLTEMTRDIKLDPEMLALGRLLISRGYPPAEDEEK